jgi:predicted phosphodiesterase
MTFDLNRRPQAPVFCWGLLSDVHGNLAALETGLEVLRAAGAERIACLGDMLGRGEPDACVRRIREVAQVVLVGNRDLDWSSRVEPETGAWIGTLPRQVAVDGLLLSHGDGRLTPALGTTQIGRGFDRARVALDRAGAWCWAFGHSHHARTWRQSSPTAAAAQVSGLEVAFDLAEPDVRYFLNVGTTGLPFGGKGGPSVAVIDPRAGLLRHLPLS